MYIIIKGRNPQSNSTPKVQASAEAFMRDGSHRRAAHLILQDRLKMFEKQGKNTGEFLEHCKRRGFMKTEDDLAIVSDVMKKSKLQKGEVNEKKANKFMKEYREMYKDGKLRPEKIKGKKL